MNYFDILNNKLIFIDELYPIDLAYGKMGLCIYLYYLSRWEENDEYRQVADRLLDEVIANMPNMRDISVENGLAGIGLGLSHLVKEEFLGGDINIILEEVDSEIFKSIAFAETEGTYLSKPMLLQLIYYFYLRHTELKSSDHKYLYQELIIKMIEMTHQNQRSDFFQEQSSFSIQNYNTPLFLFVFSKIFELNVYNQRLTKIIEEYMSQILSSIPYLHANRLFLLYGLLCIKTYLPDYQNKIIEHAELLINRIDIEYIMNFEFKNQDIYIKDGLSFVYILLYLIQKNFPDYGIAFNPQSIYKRIKNSDAWSALINRDYYLYLRKGLYDGFMGSNLVMLHINRHFKNYEV